MKVAVILVCVAVCVMLVSARKPKRCTKDRHCKTVECKNGLHTAYCHDFECHCHAEVECERKSDCAHCGNNHSCDHGHCHGDACEHHK